MFKQRLTRPWIPVETRSQKMETRQRSAAEYHSARWTRESKAFKMEHPLCRRCESRGRVTATAVTDHIVPSEIHGDFWDRKNWQPLCLPCNIAKGNEDKQLIQKFRKDEKQ